MNVPRVEIMARREDDGIMEIMDGRDIKISAVVGRAQHN